jgi:prepilin-type N-terminal cleavage/methylation domain-containing protein
MGIGPRRRTGPRPRAARGFSLIELVVVVVAVGIMAGLALDRVLPLIGRAERVAFLQTQSQLKSALLLEAAERLTRHEARTLPELAGTNPMALLLEPPGNYLGVFTRPEAETLPRAAWYFDAYDGRLVYRPGRQAKFAALDGPADRIELGVTFVYDDRDGDGAFDASGDDFEGLRLEPVHAYSWPE